MPPPEDPALTRGPSLRGLFCGGTLSDEAMTVAEVTLGGIHSNIAHAPELALGADLTDPGHVVIDFGDDGLTRGRAHPMIDPTLRMERIAREAADPTCGVLLLDLVLGHGTHPDPAGELADAVRSARATAHAEGRALPVVVSLTGTDADPQGRSRCAATALRGRCLGVPVQRRGHAARARPPREPAMTTPTPSARPLHGLLESDPVVATAGVSLFADALRDQAVPVTETQWQPPMAGTERDLARVMGDPRRVAANALAFERMTTAEAVLVDVVPASEALGLGRGTFLHAGPPLEWERASGPMRGALIGAVLFEGLADTPDDAERRLAAGEFDLEPCHHHGAVGPMAGVVSPSMWVFALRDDVHGHDSWCSLNEGLGKVLRYGAYGPEVIDRLRWMARVLGPLLRQAVRCDRPHRHQARSSPRCCRWATRATTATGPAR